MIRSWAAATLIVFADPAWPSEVARLDAQSMDAQSQEVASLKPRPGGCDRVLFNANAIFVRASTFCGHNYLDAPEGYVALEGARRCRKLMTENDALRQVKAAMLSFDRLAQAHNIGLACTMADGFARAIRARSPQFN